MPASRTPTLVRVGQARRAGGSDAHHNPMRGFRLVLVAMVLLVAGSGWYAYHRLTYGFGGPLLHVPASTPADREGQFVIAAYQTNAGSYLLNPQSGEYLPVPRPVAAVSPDLRYGVLSQDGLLVVSTETGRTVRDLGNADSVRVEWSPDGRWLAITYPNVGRQTIAEADAANEAPYINRVKLLDLVSGQVRSVDIGWIGDCHASDSFGWLPDSTSFGLVGCAGAARPEPYALVGTDRTVTQVPGWPSGASVYGRPSTQPDLAVLWPNGGSGSRQLVVYDLRSRSVRDQFAIADPPSADKPLPGHPAGVLPMGLLTSEQALVADGSQLLTWTLRTGATAPLASLPEAPVGALVAPAGGLSVTAAHLAFHLP